MNTAIKLNTPEERQLTYSEWEALHNQRKAHAEARRRARIECKKERTIYFIKQRLMGFILALDGLAAIYFLEAGEGIFFIALGLYVMFSNTRMMMFKGYRGIGKY